jgi:hypothetical protein
LTAISQVIRLSMESPTIRLEQASSTAQRRACAFGGGVLGDVGQPEQVGSLGGELPQHEVVVDRPAWLAGQAALAGVHRPDPLLGAEPVDPVAGRRQALPGELVGHEPVAELWVVVVDVDHGVDQVRVVPLHVGS